MYRNILVPIDGTDTSWQGLREAIRFAHVVAGRIRLVHVVNKTPWTAPEGTSAVLEKHIARFIETGADILSRARTAVLEAGVEADERLIESFDEKTGQLVVAEANAWPADLIVCGTHGRRGVRRMLMGSDAEYIARASSVPVLLVRAAPKRTRAHTGFASPRRNAARPARERIQEPSTMKESERA